jgi:hypothetical protein
MVMASDQLGEAELEAHAEDIDVTSMLEAMRTRVSPVLTYTITCTAGGIQCVYGQTYADAILRLFDIWSPTEPEAPRSLPAQTTDQI